MFVGIMLNERDRTEGLKLASLWYESRRHCRRERNIIVVGQISSVNHAIKTPLYICYLKALCLGGTVKIIPVTPLCGLDYCYIIDA